jgi:hypothetical protein
MPNRRPTNHPADKSLRSPLRFQSSPLCLAITLAGAVAATTLTGCGLGTADTTVSPLVTPAINGRLLGGATPIVGATVKMYTTGNADGTNGGYGVATMLQEATQKGGSLHQDTDSNGGFSFTGGYNCPAGQFAYMVATGGNSGGNSVNSNAVLVAAMGRCEDLYTLTSGHYTGYKGTPVYINELSTIAAAYALGHFATVTGTGANAVVSIGASGTNNAAQVGGVSTGCVAGVGSCTTTASAGLAHAFLNAANLVNVFNNAGAGSNVNATVPGNSAAIVPREVINTIGNLLITCVNSNGGTAGDSTNCGQLFTATTIGSSVPTNTFSAMVNLAANPTLAGSNTAVANLYNLITPASTIYFPNLTSSTGLNDYSIAINYPAGMGASSSGTPLSTCGSNPCQGLLFPTSGALDINDVYYVANSFGASGTTPVNLFAFSSNGTLLSNTTNGAATHAYGISVDALGNGYFGNGSTSGTTALAVFTTGGGSLSTYGTLKAVGGALHVYSTAVDRNNNVWAFGTAASPGPSLWMSPAGGASFTAQGTLDVTAVTSNSTGVAIDSNQNVWTASGANLAVLPNAGTVAAPTYTAAQVTTTPAGAIPNSIAFTAGAGGTPTAYLAAYQPGTTGIQPFSPTYTGAQLTTLGDGAINSVNSTITGTEFSTEADGAGAVWLADNNSHAVIQFNPNAVAANATAYRLEPCLFVAANGGCFTGTSTQNSVFTTGKPFTVSIDSTGSIWATAEAAGAVVEIIGSAAPTWPLLSLGKTGTP